MMKPLDGRFIISQFRSCAHPPGLIDLFLCLQEEMLSHPDSFHCMSLEAHVLEAPSRDMESSMCSQ